MKINFDDPTVQVYDGLIELLKCIKLVQGPEGVYSTLRRHKNVRDFLRQYQIDSLKSLENYLSDIDNQ